MGMRVAAYCLVILPLCVLIEEEEEKDTKILSVLVYYGYIDEINFRIVVRIL